MITVIGPRPTRTARVLWMLEELALPYTHLPSPPHSPDVLAHSEAGKVPVVLIEGMALTDSTAILTFLADRSAQFTAPAGSLARAAQDGVTQFVLDEMDALLWTAARHSFILPADQRVAEIKPSLKWEFARALTRLDQRLKGPFLMGDAPSVPDIIATHCLRWAMVSKFPVAEGRLADYATRMTARPAFLRAMAA